MSVTESYKTVKFSSDALMYVKDAVMARLISDKARIEVAKDSAFIDFLRREIATGTEVLNALNSGAVLTREDTHGALDGALLATVLRELHHMRRLVVGCHVMSDMPAARAARLGSLDAALLFLENPK
jgi:hypothetical protein